MENKEPKPNRRRKIIQASILGLLLVVLPAMSYYYLGLGFSKRKETMDELRHYGQVRPENLIYPDGEKENRLAGKVCIIYFFGDNPQLTETNRKVLDMGEALFQQFSGDGRRDDIRLVMISEGGASDFRTYAQTRPSADFLTWVWSRSLNQWNGVLTNARAQFEKDSGIDTDTPAFGLADSDGVIRRFYEVDDEKQLSKMINHIATLLPKK